MAALPTSYFSEWWTVQPFWRRLADYNWLHLHKNELSKVFCFYSVININIAVEFREDLKLCCFMKFYVAVLVLQLRLCIEVIRCWFSIIFLWFSAVAFSSHSFQVGFPPPCFEQTADLHPKFLSCPILPWNNNLVMGGAIYLTSMKSNMSALEKYAKATLECFFTQCTPKSAKVR